MPAIALADFPGVLGEGIVASHGSCLDSGLQ
jgi:hypothetical protein